MAWDFSTEPEFAEKLAWVEQFEGLWPTEYFPAKREQARKKYAHLIAADPDLAAWADAAARAMTRP